MVSAHDEVSIEAGFESLARYLGIHSPLDDTPIDTSLSPLPTLLAQLVNKVLMHLTSVEFAVDWLLVVDNVPMKAAFGHLFSFAPRPGPYRGDIIILSRSPAWSTLKGRDMIQMLKLNCHQFRFRLY